MPSCSGVLFGRRLSHTHTHTRTRFLSKMNAQRGKENVQTGTIGIVDQGSKWRKLWSAAGSRQVHITDGVPILPYSSGGFFFQVQAGREQERKKPGQDGLITPIRRERQPGFLGAKQLRRCGSVLYEGLEACVVVGCGRCGRIRRHGPGDGGTVRHGSKAWLWLQVS